MKDVVKVKKEEKKVFTERKSKEYNRPKVKPLISKILIKFTDISRLNSCNRCIYERGGLYMEETKVISKEIKKCLDWKLKIFVKIFPKTCIKLYRKGIADCFKYYNK